ncbi:MAG: hypothetical protein ACBR50_28645 [Microcoleus sp.]
MNNSDVTGFDITPRPVNFERTSLRLSAAAAVRKNISRCGGSRHSKRRSQSVGSILGSYLQPT